MEDSHELFERTPHVFYVLRCQAGRILKSIHSIPANAMDQPWKKRYFSVISERLAASGILPLCQFGNMKQLIPTWYTIAKDKCATVKGSCN